MQCSTSIEISLCIQWFRYNPIPKMGIFVREWAVLHGRDTRRVVELQDPLSMTTEKTHPAFFQPKNSLAITGLAAHRWRDMRLAGILVEGVHYTRGGGGTIYITAMCLDGLVQGFDSPEHIAACNRWLRSLPSNGAKK